jgi:transcriptional regulator with XRE-family HTH domain
MSDGSQALSRDMLWQDYYANLKTALSSMRQMFKTRAATDRLTQDEIAASLNIDKSLVSRRLNGEENFTLKTLSFMATAMRCRLQIRFRPYEELGHGNNYHLVREAEEPPRGLPNDQLTKSNELKGLDQAA